jgi:hypothetical protein
MKIGKYTRETFPKIIYFQEYMGIIGEGFAISLIYRIMKSIASHIKKTRLSLKVWFYMN